ncbi:MAG: acyl-[acyl-carrier-protein] thioesterase [Lachnospiraceae bacterium]|nr:acyl-[acyl-carrier-protein] thioesterase [Lachnospiraceae bacterium]
MYIYNKKILYSDIDEKSNMSVEGIMNAMQDCININSESIGKGVDYMKKTKRAWFAIGWNIYIKRYPALFENIVVKTWPYGFSSSMGYRNVVITDSDGEDIVCADSVWSLVDTNSGKPIRIEECDTKGYDIEERYQMEELSRKIKLPAEFEDMELLPVRKAYIDFNGHMGNAKYIQIANEYVPSDAHVKRIRVEYKSQSRYGEKLLLSTACEETDSGQRFIVKITGQEKQDIKSVVEFKL